jgi:hypothetical protein
MVNRTPNSVALSNAIPGREQHEFIKAEDVEELSGFFLIGARNFTIDKNKPQILFDIEFVTETGRGKNKKKETVIRALTLSTNEEREDIRDAVRQHKRIGPVKLERKKIAEGKRTYLTFVDSEDVAS